MLLREEQIEIVSRMKLHQEGADQRLCRAAVSLENDLRTVIESVKIVHREKKRVESLCDFRMICMSLTFCYKMFTFLHLIMNENIL